MAQAAMQADQQPRTHATRPSAPPSHLRVQVALADLLVQQLPHGALKLGRDLLRLVRHVEAGQLLRVVASVRNMRWKGSGPWTCDPRA